MNVPDVGLQIALGGGPVRAEVAGERLFPRVGAQVTLKVDLTAKSLGAESAVVSNAALGVWE